MFASLSHLYRRAFCAALVLAALFLCHTSAHADTNSQYFPQTGHTVSGTFLTYWQTNGGLPIFGYPITDAQNEVDPETGKAFLTQWFERRRFELHPENADTKYEVLGGLIGKDLRREALAVDPDFLPNPPYIYDEYHPENEHYFPETGHLVYADFYAYWQQHGGLDQFGFPISEEHEEIDPATGGLLDVQWFERARFEHHYNSVTHEPIVLLGLLGDEIKAPKKTVKYVWGIGPDTHAVRVPVAVATDAQGNLFVLDEAAQVAKFDPTGHLLTKWGEIGSGNGQFKDPQYIALDHLGNVYVSDTGNCRVQKFDSTGHFLLAWGGVGTKTGQFGNNSYGVSGLAVDSQNNVYVADINVHRIQKFDSNGNFLFTWGSHGKAKGQMDVPRGLAIDRDDNIYEYDSWNRRIQKFDKNGNFLLTWGSQGNKPGQFAPQDNGPAGMAIDAQNNVWVTDPEAGRIQGFDPQGNFLTQLRGGSYDHPFFTPVSVAFTPRGTLYVADGNEVDAFDTSQTLLTRWDYPAAKPGTFAFNTAIATDSAGNLYASSENGIHVFDRNGVFLREWGSYGKGDGQFRIVTGIALDAQANVYVVDAGNKRIQKFDAAGHLLLKWGDATLFSQPYAIAVDPLGSVYVTDIGTNHILKFDYSGNATPGWTGTALGKTTFDALTAIAVDAHGTLYVGAGDHIAKYPGRTYAPNILFGHNDGNPNVEALSTDAQGNVYAIFTYYVGIDSITKYIEKFDTSGAFVLDLPSVGDNGFFFAYPFAVAADDQGSVYASDGGRVHKYRLP